ncbi:MAG: POTRA domain-containing protein, partial [Chlorobium sp.]
MSSLLLSFLLLQPVAPLPGATIPDGGALLRDQQNSLQQPKELPHREKERAVPSTEGEGVMVEVKGFSFSGYDGVATERELQSLVAGARGRTLSFSQLNALVETLAAHFREKGWGQVRVWLPAQDITSGMVQITITQVKSDGLIALKGDKSVRIREGALRGFVQPVVHPNQPVNEHELERSLLLLNDLPGLMTKANFVPTARPAISSLEVSVSEGSLFSGMLWGDNQGNRYTGFGRGNASFSINDPL